VTALGTTARWLPVRAGKLPQFRTVQGIALGRSNCLIRSNAAREGVYQRGLPDAGFSSNKNDLTFTRKHLLKPVLHSCQCFIATNKSPGQIFAGQT